MRSRIIGDSPSRGQGMRNREYSKLHPKVYLWITYDIEKCSPSKALGNNIRHMVINIVLCFVLSSDCTRRCPNENIFASWTIFLCVLCILLAIPSLPPMPCGDGSIQMGTWACAQPLIIPRHTLSNANPSNTRSDTSREVRGKHLNQWGKERKRGLRSERKPWSRYQKKILSRSYHQMWNPLEI